jgi:NitT/TauT family transport system permease protein
MREAILQALFMSMFVDLWWSPWIIFRFPASANAGAVGSGVLTVIVLLVLFINWSFRSSFTGAARTRGAIVTKEAASSRIASYGAFILTVTCLVLWLATSQWPFSFLPTSPVDVLKAALFLFKSGEIWSDIPVSLLEIVGGIILGASVGLVTFWFSSFNNIFTRWILFLLPLTYISPLIIWLMSALTLIPNSEYFPLFFFHRIVLIGGLSFYPFVQTFWALSDRPLHHRVLLAADDALPVACATMILGEAYAATVGIGFMMVVAGATYQIDKGLVGSLLIVGLLVLLSFTLRFIAKRRYLPEHSVAVVPGQAS